MLGILDHLRQEGNNPYAPVNKLATLRTSLDKLESQGKKVDFGLLMKASFTLGTVALVMGHEEEAIDHLLDTYSKLQDQGLSESAIASLFWLGVANLRLAETQNCCSRQTPDSCLIPIKGQGIHTRREGSTRAIKCFEAILKNAKPNSAEYKNAIWLLNIAHMTLGDYPDKVPEEYLISPSTFASDEQFPRFMNVAEKVGLNALNNAGGAIVDDFNGDGHLDVMVSEMDLGGNLRFWTNEGNGSFVERTEEAGLNGFFGGLNIVQADYNNDGALDVLILRGGWMQTFGRHPKSLLHNNGDGTFTDVTFDAGLGEASYPTQTASWSDFDNDGDLDLYVGNEHDSTLTAPCQLFRNNGDETFTDVAASAGVTNDRYAKAVVWGDYDQDRYPDIYVSNLNGDNRLYHNNGDGTFTDVAPVLFVAEPRHSFPAWFWDYDNDGALDIYVSAYQINVAHLALQAMGHKVSVETQKLYRGNGLGGFDDATKSCQLDEMNAPMGANFGDIDNDGYLDFYLGTGRPNYWELMPNVMYHNRKGVDFADITTAGGFGSIQKGHGIAFADIDHDGDCDVFSQMGGAFPGDKYFNSLYENPGFGNHYISLQLEGVKSNRSAIGARIRIDLIDEGKARSIYRHVNSGGSFGANPLQQVIGLGLAKRIEMLEVFWPTTGRTQKFTNLSVDQQVRVVEDAKEFQSQSLQSFSLGGATETTVRRSSAALTKEFQNAN